MEDKSPVRENTGVSVILPIYNEESLLEQCVVGISDGLKSRFPGRTWEILLVENGSRDSSAAVAERLAGEIPGVRGFSMKTPSYGKALRFGILHAAMPATIVYNVDYWNLDFAERALELLRENDVIVGSKCAFGAVDKRAFSRRLATRAFNLMLRLAFGFKGTDTHGMKAFRTALVAPIAEQCVTDREVFDTELIIRAQRAGLRVAEVPVDVEEVRPTRYGFAARLPSVLRDLRRIRKSLKAQKYASREA